MQASEELSSSKAGGGGRGDQEPLRGGQDLKNRCFSLYFSMFFENSIFATKTAGKSILVPQGLAKSAQEPPKCGQDRPKSAQDRPKSGPRGPQEVNFRAPTGGRS